MGIITSVLIGYTISIFIVILMRGKTKWEQRLYAILKRKSKLMRKTIIVAGNIACYLLTFLAYKFHDIAVSPLLNIAICIMVVSIIVLIWIFVSITIEVNKNNK